MEKVNMKKYNIQRSCLIEIKYPKEVLLEVKNIISFVFPKFDFRPFGCVFYDIVRLFHGEYPGYKKCNTEYHDLKHTTDTLMAMARLIHGFSISQEYLNEKDIFLGLVSALMHDTGYIQTSDDRLGTGARYTLDHVERSMLFMEKYFEKNNYFKKDFMFCKNCLSCTALNTKINEINFESQGEEAIGKMLGTADLLGQMADRTYLEKLLFLYYEFLEGGVLGYKNELDILEKTLGFYNMTKKRFTHELDNLDKYMIYHFKKRWNIDRDLYKESIEKNIEYLKYILENHKRDYHVHLKRGNIKKKLYEKRNINSINTGEKSLNTGQFAVCSRN